MLKSCNLDKRKLKYIGKAKDILKLDIQFVSLSKYIDDDISNAVEVSVNLVEAKEALWNNLNGSDANAVAYCNKPNKVDPDEIILCRRDSEFIKQICPQHYESFTSHDAFTLLFLDRKVSVLDFLADYILSEHNETLNNTCTALLADSDQAIYQKRPTIDYCSNATNVPTIKEIHDLPVISSEGLSTDMATPNALSSIPSSSFNAALLIEPSVTLGTSLLSSIKDSSVSQPISSLPLSSPSASPRIKKRIPEQSSSDLAECEVTSPPIAHKRIGEPFRRNRNNPSSDTRSINATLNKGNMVDKLSDSNGTISTNKKLHCIRFHCITNTLNPSPCDKYSECRSLYSHQTPVIGSDAWYALRYEVNSIHHKVSRNLLSNYKSQYQGLLPSPYLALGNQFGLASIFPKLKETKRVVDYCFHYFTNECKGNCFLYDVTRTWKCKYCSGRMYHGLPIKDSVEWKGLKEYMVNELNAYCNRYSPIPDFGLIYDSNEKCWKVQAKDNSDNTSCRVLVKPLHQSVSHSTNHTASQQHLSKSPLSSVGSVVKASTSADLSGNKRNFTASSNVYNNGSDTMVKRYDNGASHNSLSSALDLQSKSTCADKNTSNFCSSSSSLASTCISTSPVVSAPHVCNNNTTETVMINRVSPLDRLNTINIVSPKAEKSSSALPILFHTSDQRRLITTAVNDNNTIHQTR